MLLHLGAHNKPLPLFDGGERSLLVHTDVAGPHVRILILACVGVGWNELPSFALPDCGLVPFLAWGRRAYVCVEVAPARKIAHLGAQVLCLLALLVQKYKY